MESDNVYTVVEDLCVEDTNVLDSCDQFSFNQRFYQCTSAQWYTARRSQHIHYGLCKQTALLIQKVCIQHATQDQYNAISKMLTSQHTEYLLL